MLPSFCRLPLLVGLSNLDDDEDVCRKKDFTGGDAGAGEDTRGRDGVEGDKAPVDGKPVREEPMVGGGGSDSLALPPKTGCASSATATVTGDVSCTWLPEDCSNLAISAATSDPDNVGAEAARAAMPQAAPREAAGSCGEADGCGEGAGCGEEGLLCRWECWRLQLRRSFRKVSEPLPRDPPSLGEQSTSGVDTSP